MINANKPFKEDKIMKSIVFIIPYFGKFPNYFKLWLESCRYNSTIDFLIFTNDKTYFEFPANVKVNYISFDDLKKLIQSKYDFEIVLPKAYKLCDFKPAYGEIFQDYIKEYDYWGYCDIDLIWGDIRKFITDDILTKNKRILTHGHCTVIENSKAVNAYYRTLPTFNYVTFKRAFTTPMSKFFDEWNITEGGGTSYIFKDNNIPMYDETTMFDINYTKGNFKSGRRNDNGKKQYYLFDNGKLYQVSSYGKVEGMYAHFQKRKLIIDKDLNYSNYFLISPYYVTSNRKMFKPYWFRKRKFEINFQIYRIKSHIVRERMRKKLRKVETND